MQIKQLAATFGRLENETLDLEPGLNIIEAPNEAGKSTWTAFLRVMLYGLNTRDRSATADKRRYLPWSGSAMQGQITLATAQGDVTITRRTARSNSPMGAFSAVHTGSSEPVAWLTAADCGETLLGVPQDVFERSAYIRQSGLAVDQSAALERRIASLITTGEEDISFTDAAERLKKQLNTRRHNKTGQLPQLEREAQELRSRLSELEQLSRQVDQAQQEQEAVQARIREAEEQLSRHIAADQADAAMVVENARLDLASARDKLKTLERSARNLPSRSELESLRGRVDALAAMDQAAAEAKARLEVAARDLRQAEKAAASSPYAGMTPAEAAALPVAAPPRPAPFKLLPLLAALCGLLPAVLVGVFSRRWIPAIAGGLGLFVLILAAAAFSLRRRQQRWDTQYADLGQKRKAAVDTYTAIYEKAAEAQSTYQGALAAYEAVAAGSKSNLDQILNQIRAFRPLVPDLSAARQALDAGFDMCRQLDQARQEEDAARLRWEARRDSAPPVPPVPVERPKLSRERLARDISDAEAQLASVRQRIHTTQGRIQALGDPGELQAQLQRLEERETGLQQEYDAIALAMEVLFVSNSSIQTRFSPTLGDRAAAIFTKLTKGKYNKVLLDKDIRPSAQEAGEFVSHEAAFLSQGAADQLYLAVRLAICDMVLPADRAAPVLLDDALVNFDDERMAAALDYLLELSERRQVLVFTCQRREADYLRFACPERFHYVKL